MSPTDPAQLPNVAAILASVLARVPREHQPLLIALAERMAARRYREWARDPAGAPHASRLLACAEREEDIASRVEGLYADAATLQRDLLAASPDLEDVNHAIFAGRPLAQQFAIQAGGERLGAATWRAFTAEGHDPRRRDVLLACAALEEENAGVLEAILGTPHRPVR
jgi:hypothetical protein